MDEPADSARDALVQGLFLALAGSRLGVLLADAQGRIERVNAALCARSGLAAAQLLGQPLGEPALWPDGAAGLAQALAAGQAWQGDVHCRGADQRPLRAGAELSPLALPEQPLAGWLLLLHWDGDASPAAPAPATTALPPGPGRQGSAATADARLLADLRRALDAGQLALHYQPQLSLFSGEIVGAEALLRWTHPERGAIAPRDFLPLAEDSGLIIPISEWVLSQACGQAARWREQGLPPIRMGVNLSARHFRFNDLLETVRRTLRHSGLPPRGLDLELTESVVMHDLPSAVRAVDALKALGVRLSLDDFGTGLSSLAYLSRFAIDTLKIDRGFVRDVASNAVNAAIVSATIAMAHKLGKSVIAEGVETEEQMHFLRGRECDEMQGFLFSAALPPEELAARLGRGDRINLHGGDAPGAGENRLLLVDDEPNILTALRRLLRREGYTIVTAADGAEALELLAHEPVQVIVSDQRMPGMSGTELLNRVKLLYPRTVRIALSGYADLATVTDAVNQGAIYRYLSKPWDDEALKGEIREAFRHWRAQPGAAGAAPQGPA